MNNDVNLVYDNMIPNYCNDNWPTILDKLADPLKGPVVIQFFLILIIVINIVGAKKYFI